MKHKTLNTLLIIIICVSNIFSYDLSNGRIKTKSYSFDNNNNSYIHFNDSLFHVITNLSNDKFLNKRSIVLTIDKNLKILENKNIIDENNLILSGIKLKNDNYLFIGHSRSSNDEWNKILLVKTDKNFNLIWKKNYGADNFDCKGYSVQEKNSNEYLILGYTKASKNNVLLIKVDSNGDEKWFSYLPNLKCTFANQMLYENQNEIIIAGQNEKSIFVSKIDSVGNIIWNYNLNDNLNSYNIYDIKKTNDDGYIIIGNTNYNRLNKKDILILKIKKNGIEEWRQIFGNKYSEVVYDIEETLEGNFIMCGFYIKNKKNQYCSFITKVNNQGQKIDQIALDFIESNRLYDISIKTHLNKYEIFGIGNIESNDSTKIFTIQFEDDFN